MNGNRSRVLSAVVVTVVLLLGLGLAAQAAQLTLTYPGSPEEFVILEQVMAEMRQEFPDIDVELIHIPPGEYWNKVQIMFASNTQPDLLFMSEPFPTYARRNQLLNLEPFIADTPGFDFDDFYPATVDYFRYDGTLYGLPKDANPFVVFYNEDLFAEAGLETPYELWRKGEWTWDAYLQTAKALTKDTTGDGRVDQYGVAATFPVSWVYANWIWLNGGAILSEDRSRSMFDQPEAIEAIQWLADLANVHRVAPSPEVDQATVSFMTGRVAMETNGAFAIAGYKTVTDFHWDIAPYPVVEGKPMQSYLHIGGWAIAEQTPYPEEAWVVLQYLTSRSTQGRIAQLVHGGMPPRSSVAETDVYLRAEGMPNNSPIFLELAAAGRRYPFTTVYFETETLMQEEIGLVFLGEKTAEEAVADLVPRLNNVLRRR